MGEIIPWTLFGSSYNNCFKSISWVSKVGTFQSPSMSFPTMHSGTREINQSGVVDVLHSLWDWLKSKIHISSGFKNPYSEWWTTVIYRIPKGSINSELKSRNHQKICFAFQRHRSLGKWLHELWGMARKATYNVCTCGSTVVFLKGDVPLRSSILRSMASSSL